MRNISQLQAIVDEIADKHNKLDTIDKLNHALLIVPTYSDCMLDVLRDALRRRYISDNSKAVDKFITGLLS